MSKKTYTLSLIAAAALGAGTMKVSDTSTEAAGRPETKHERVCFTSSDEVKNEIEFLVEDEYCGSDCSDLEFACNIPEDLTHVEMFWHQLATPDDMIVCANFDISGSHERVCFTSRPETKTEVEAFIDSEYCDKVSFACSVPGNIAQMTMFWRQLSNPGGMSVCIDFEIAGTFIED